MGEINLMENKVLGPMILREIELRKREGRHDLLQEQLTEKFGALPAWAAERLRLASTEDQHTWAIRILNCATLEDTLR